MMLTPQDKKEMRADGLSEERRKDFRLLSPPPLTGDAAIEAMDDLQLLRPHDGALKTFLTSYTLWKL